MDPSSVQKHHALGTGTNYYGVKGELPAGDESLVSPAYTGILRVEDFANTFRHEGHTSDAERLKKAENRWFSSYTRRLKKSPSRTMFGFSGITACLHARKLRPHQEPPSPCHPHKQEERLK